MRPALAIALLCAGVSPVTAEPQPGPAAISGPTQSYQTRQQQIESKSKQSQEEQEVRNKRFDLDVKKATGSICIGCIPDAGSGQPRRKEARPKRAVE